MIYKHLKRVAINATLIIIFFQTSCSNSFSVNHPKKILTTQFITSSPFLLIKPDSSIVYFQLNDTTNIYALDSYKLYRIKPELNFEDYTNILGSNPYFIIKNNTQFGKYYINLNDSSIGRDLHKDSVLNKWVRMPKYPFKLPDSVFNHIQERKKSEIIDIYWYKKDYGAESPDSIKYYFNSLYKELNDSFSEYFDSLYNSKCYKIRYIYNSKYSFVYNKVLPNREHSFELKMGNMFDSIKEINLLNNYIQNTK